VSTLSELFPAGGGDNSIEINASGTLSNGDILVMKSDGTTEVTAGSGAAGSFPDGATIPVVSSSVYYPVSAINPHNASQVIFVWTVWATNVRAVLGTISGTTITFGSTVNFYAGTGYYLSVAWDGVTSNTGVITYNYASGNSYGVCHPFTINSGSVVSPGSAYTTGVYSIYLNCVADKNAAGKFLFAYAAGGNTVMRVITVSGGAASAGSPYTHSPGYHAEGNAMSQDASSGAFYIAYPYSGVYMRRVTRSGTTLSLSSPTQVTPNIQRVERQALAASALVSNSVLLGYMIIGWKSVVVASTWNGSSFTTGSQVILKSPSYYCAVAADPHNTGTFGALYYPNHYRKITVAGTTITLEGSQEDILSSGENFSISYNPTTANKLFFSARTGSGFEAEFAQESTLSTNLTEETLLGVAKTSATNGNTLEVDTLGGIAEGFSGLAIGSVYYASSTGGITTTSGAPNVKLGKAITSTSINLRNL
jgi:hypothetical protein